MTFGIFAALLRKMSRTVPQPPLPALDTVPPWRALLMLC